MYTNVYVMCTNVYVMYTNVYVMYTNVLCIDELHFCETFKLLFCNGFIISMMISYI